jgi:hypothetical protein
MGETPEGGRRPDVARMLAGANWFDLWHTHVDWRGEGNAGPQERQPFLRALFALWAEVETVARDLTCPWQSWLVIDAGDSSQDAVYLHTPNPNRDNFPYPFAGVVWGVEPPDWLAELLTGTGAEVGRSDHEGAELFWVRRGTTITF